MELPKNPLTIVTQVCVCECVCVCVCVCECVCVCVHAFARVQSTIGVGQVFVILTL
jgi:hypothetical protein